MQLSLFGLANGPAPLGLVPPPEPLMDLARRLPSTLRMGTSSWSFPGWKGILWDQPANEARLAREGLGVYARHPLLRTVGLDRAHYRPPTLLEYQGIARQVPEDFRFLVKAHEACTLARFPSHPRYGKDSGNLNERYLDPGYAAEVVAPALEGMGGKLGVILFQFAPQNLGDMGGRRFPDLLHAFLARLPRGCRYAVELRNPQFLHEGTADAMLDLGVTPALSGWSGLPSVREQALRLKVDRAPIRVIRWMLPQGRAYEETKAAFEPFDRLVGPDPGTREEIAELARGPKETYLIVNNKAEGCSPLSVFALAEQILQGRGSR